jgi:hypothetical protein
MYMGVASNRYFSRLLLCSWNFTQCLVIAQPGLIIFIDTSMSIFETLLANSVTKLQMRLSSHLMTLQISIVKPEWTLSRLHR